MDLRNPICDLLGCDGPIVLAGRGADPAPLRPRGWPVRSAPPKTGLLTR